jgi:D-alanyl-D-alanine carboxypeptidase (penicillin-binding protein 5/6)
MTRSLRASLGAAVAAAAIIGAPAGAAAQSGGPRAPRPSAPAYILVEPATGDVVQARRADRRRAIASTTKLMTALVAVERLKLDRTIAAIPYRAAPVESVLGQRGGERFSVRDQLRALLLASANDAAATLAVRAAGSRARFVRLMNARARQLGLRDTRFANPVGLDDPDNYSTPADLAKLALVARTNPFLRETMDRPRVTLRTGDRPRTIVNRNTLVRTQPFVTGVKTGRTSQAGYVLIGSASRGGVSVVAVVMGAGTEAARNADTLALLRHGLRRYRRTTVVRRGEALGRARLAFREEAVPLVAARSVRRTARRGEELPVRIVGAPAELDGPVPKGAQVGQVEVRQRGAVIDRVPLVTGAAVDGATTLERVSHAVEERRTALTLAGVGVGSLLVVLLWGRATRRRKVRTRET